MSIEQKVCWTARCDDCGSSFESGEWNPVFYFDQATLEMVMVESDWTITDGHVRCFDCECAAINADADAEESPAS